jgi:Domain of unknown function (DUF222)
MAAIAAAWNTGVLAAIRRRWFGMCTANGADFGSVAEALRAGLAFADYLNASDAAELEPAALGEALVSLGEIQSRIAVAHAEFLFRFDAHDGHDADGYASSSAWLAAMTRLSKRDAKAAVKRMRVIAKHPPIARGMAAGEISDSWGREIVSWLGRLPEELRDGTEEILAQAASAGASLDDLATIVAAALAQWEAEHPDEDDDGFPDRFLQVETTFGGAGVIRGDLTPECAAAVTAVLEALGKKAGPEDDRTTPQRFHDALQLACELLLRAKLVPDRSGADTQVVANISLRDLRAMPGAGGLEDAWIRALLGEGGYLTGADAEAAACDAMIVPVVAGTMNGATLDQMIGLVLAAFGHSGPSGDDPRPAPDREAHREEASRLSAAAESAFAASSPTAGSSFSAFSAFTDARPGPGQISPQAWQALRYAVARLAVDLVSGPAGIASTLRRGLLEHPWNTPSFPLDVGYSDSIPAAIRRAVLWRDRYKCAWPRCDRPAAWCDVHHIEHKRNGGKTSVKTCVTLCQFHHDTCVHRRGWRIVLNPDGGVSVYGPDGQAQHSHSPPTIGAG